MSAGAGFAGAESRADALAGLDARSRLLALLILATTTVMLHSGAALTAALGVAALAAALARVSPRLLLRRLAALDGLMLLVLLTLPFTVPGERLIVLGPLTASAEGVTQALIVAAKANAVLLLTLALTAGMPPAAIGHALVRLGLPQRLVHLLLLTLRYVGLLEEEYRRLRRAMTVRAFRPGSNRHTWVSLGWLVGMLLVRSAGRAERVLAAMRCRGWDGGLRFVDAGRLGRVDAAFAALGVVVVAGLLVLDHG